MRLICPNCGAQYEVPDDVIPETGRDVQCSNCGDTWFQKHPSHDRELAEDLEQPLDEAHWDDEPAPAAEGWSDEPEEPDEIEDEVAAAADQAPPEDRPEAAAGDDALWQDEDDEEAGDDWADADRHEAAPEGASADWDGFDDVEEPDTTAPPQMKPLDPEVREVLREEAEHELRARAAESGGLETQPDLGLDDAPLDEAGRREREARLRMARMRGLPDEAAQNVEAELAAHASRRDLLPDIDEINSTLRKDSDRAAMADGDGATITPAPAEAKSFSRGFRTIVLIAGLAIVVYVFAGQIADMVPAAAGAMETYVGWIDTGRAWLDQMALSLTGYLDGLMSE